MHFCIKKKKNKKKIRLKILSYKIKDLFFFFLIKKTITYSTKKFILEKYLKKVPVAVHSLKKVEIYFQI